jgi:hypothetical protein
VQNNPASYNQLSRCHLLRVAVKPVAVRDLAYGPTSAPQPCDLSDSKEGGERLDWWTKDCPKGPYAGAHVTKYYLLWVRHDSTLTIAPVNQLNSLRTPNDTEFATSQPCGRTGSAILPASFTKSVRPLLKI